MGRSTRSDFMKAVVTIWNDGDSICVKRSTLPPDVLIPYFNAKFDVTFKDVPEVTLPVTIEGWTSPNLNCHPYEQIGAKKRISAEYWSKGDKKVYEFNEHPDQSGGAVCMTYCADSEEVLNDWLSDLGLVGDICIDEVIQQTL